MGWHKRGCGGATFLRHPTTSQASQPTPQCRRSRGQFSGSSRGTSWRSLLLAARLTHDRIQEGQFYEAHQQLRVIAARYVKQNNADAAADILFSGAQALLKAGQGGSGSDLCLFLVDVLAKADVKPDAESKGRLLSLLRAFPHGEPTRKKFVAEMVACVPRRRRPWQRASTAR